MPRALIKNIRTHANNEHLKAHYSFDAPLGQWIARFDERAWGQAQNLLCYFTDQSSGEGYCLSVFNNKGYQPTQGDISFDEVPFGKTYEITTEKGRNGYAKFVKAIEQ